MTIAYTTDDSSPLILRPHFLRHLRTFSPIITSTPHLHFLSLTLALFPLGQINAAFGWRNAFLFTGVPGIAVAFLVWFIKDPGLGAFEDKTPPASLVVAAKVLSKNKIYLCVRHPA